MRARQNSGPWSLRLIKCYKNAVPAMIFGIGLFVTEKIVNQMDFMDLILKECLMHLFSLRPSDSLRIVAGHCRVQ